jgi:endoglucanase
MGIKRGTQTDESRRRIMLSAHMDEIALFVSEVRDGYARMTRISGVDGRTLQAKSVIVHGRRSLIGTIAAIPPHISQQMSSENNKYPEIEDQWVDFGLPSDEVAELVSVGDLVTMDAAMLELKGELLAGKSMDDRASVAAVSYCLKLLQKRVHQWDVYAVASTQEEKGLQGATTAAYAINPDLAIAIDVGFGKQPGVNGDAAVDLGKGPTIGIGPNFHPGFREAVEKIAKECEIPLHPDPISGRSGTDAWAIQVARRGVPTTLLSIPLRNMHSAVETLSLRDVKRIGRLMAEVITALDEEFLQSIAWKRKEEEETNEDDD